MAETLVQLKRRAKDAGIEGYRGMAREELEAALANGSQPKAKRKKAVAGTVKKKTRNATPQRKQARRKSIGDGAAPSSKETKRKLAAAAKAKRGPGRPRKNAAAPARSNSNGDAGRNLIESVDFSITEGWNPREGGARHTIWLALKKARGNREKAFQALLPRISEFVSNKKANGEKRTKAEREDYLRYQVNRVLFDFVVQTGQHVKSENRAQYGTGGTGAGTFKRAGARKSATKAQPTRKSTRKPARAQKGSQSRTTGKKRGPGRPKGSKNKK